ncbi:MAG: hypothetical protein PHV13_00010 [Candidatus ainarchaeum sp.]|nr:hypothetical protein [Candidatus ainarchaeum sp.]
MPNRQSRIMAQAKEMFRRAKDFVLPEFMVPALTGVAAGATGAGNASARVHRPSTDHLTLFDSGPAPKAGTSSRKLMDWQTSPEVLEANDVRDSKKLQMNYTEAQRAVSDILSDPTAVHPYITSEAARMYNDDPLVRKHLWHMVVGALAEDYTFMPGESLGSICNNHARVPDALKLIKMPGEASSGSSVMRWILIGFTKIVNVFKRDPYGDPADRPYWAHFFQRTGVLTGNGLTMFNGDLTFQSSAERLRAYWKLAVDYYSKGDTPRAFYALGHAVHLVQDMHVPAHVHNDVHGPTFLLGKVDSFEKWTARGDWPSITRGNGDSNVSIWDNGPIARPAADRTWNKDNIVPKLAALAGTIAYKTQQLRSVDAEGTGVVLKNQTKTGALSDAECYEQARIQIPDAIRHSGQLIINFVDYVKRNGEPAA